MGAAAAVVDDAPVHVCAAQYELDASRMQFESLVPHAHLLICDYTQ